MSGKVYIDELGEVENLSIFEQYPEFAKRLLIFVSVLVALGGGVWYVLSADKPVECGQNLNQVYREECKGDLYCIKEYRGPQCLEIWVQKKISFPTTVTAWVDKKQMEGIGGQRYVLLVDNQPRRLASLAWMEGQEPDFLLRHMGVIAGTGAAHNPPAAYELPLPSNVGFQTISPKDPLADRHLLGMDHTVTFVTGIGTPVYAMRAGTVVAKRDDQPVGGNRESSVGAENYLMIRHSDGTVALYENLHRGSVPLAVGDKVQAEQFIAVSGNSGYAEYPVLTVSVLGTAEDGEVQSFPIMFATAQGDRKVAPFEIVMAPENRNRSSRLEQKQLESVSPSVPKQQQQTSTAETRPKPVSPIDLIKQKEKEQKPVR